MIGLVYLVLIVWIVAGGFLIYDVVTDILQEREDKKDD